MSDSDTPYTSIKRKGQGSRPQKKKTRSSGPLEDEDDTPTPRSLRKRTNKHENGDSNEFGDKPRSKRRKLFHRVYKTHIKSLCEFVLEGMMEHKFASPFMHPVDTNKYPSYLDKVKEPMDFSTIKKKMDKDTYTEAEDFAMDVRLIFKNCLTFNDHESDLVFMAQSLRKLFEEAFTEIKRREKRYLDDLEFEEMKQLIEDLKNEHQRMLTELNRLVSAASPKLTTTDANASVEAPKKEKKTKRPWDLKRKEELSRAISSLNETQVSDLLIPFITALIPGCLSSGDLELDLANQPEEKLTKLEKWVKKTLKSGDVNGHVDIDGVSSDSASESEKKIVAATSQTQVSAPEIKSTEEPKHVSEESSTREEKDKKDDKPPELEMEPHPISSKTTIVQTTTEEKTEDASSTTSLPKSDPVDIMQVDNAQVDSASEQKAVETTEPRAVEMTEATITTQS